MATVIAATLPHLRATADSGFTIARLRDAVPGGFAGVSDATLQTLLGAAVYAVNEAIGEPGEMTETFTVSGDLAQLSRRAASITAVVENTRWTPVTLTADDYELSDSRLVLTRLRTGTHPAYAWCGRVKSTYIPVDDTAERIRVEIELVKLAVVFNPGLASQAIGQWSESYSTSIPYAEQREAILASLCSGVGIV